MSWYTSKYPTITFLIYMYNRNNKYHKIFQMKLIKFCVSIFILMKVLNLDTVLARGVISTLDSQLYSVQLK